MLWAKSLHIVFIVSWFAGLFYLPRIYVNLAMENNEIARERLLLMGRKLFRFTTMLAVPALLTGIWLVMYGFNGGWLHAKIFLVLLVVGYHHACWMLLKKFERNANQRGHVWYRWFNEVPVVLLLAIVILVVVKPF